MDIAKILQRVFYPENEEIKNPAGSEVGRD
jgi:hypothetical protein